tara:strand:+ start:883 stop:1380 length:498 start_codon:yes stop_codon:yes gene_type:complete
MTLKIVPDLERDTLFVKIYLQTGDALDACTRCNYMSPGYDTRMIAEYLLERPDIQLAIETGGNEARGPVEITRDSIVTDLETIHGAALHDDNFVAAISAKKTQAQLLGLLTSEVNINHHHEVTQMTDEQLIALLERKRKGEGHGKMIDITPDKKLIGIGSPDVAS